MPGSLACGERRATPPPPPRPPLMSVGCGLWGVCKACKAVLGWSHAASNLSLQAPQAIEAECHAFSTRPRPDCTKDGQCDSSAEASGKEKLTAVSAEDSLQADWRLRSEAIASQSRLTARVQLK